MNNAVKRSIHNFERMATPESCRVAACSALMFPIVVLVGSSTACGQRNASADTPSTSTTPSSATFMVQPDGMASQKTEAAFDDTAQRRGYGPVDMRFSPCVSRDGDNLLRGQQCSPGILVYGPYVSVPANSQIEVSFDVQPIKTAEVYADTVSQMGKQVFGGLNPQTVAGGQTQRLGYFVNVSNADANVESRIGFRSGGDIDFVISNLTMTVR